MSAALNDAFDSADVLGKANAVRRLYFPALVLSDEVFNGPDNSTDQFGRHGPAPVRVIHRTVSGCTCL